jgi:ankyrin repeat protein
LDSLKDKTTPRMITRALERLPKGSEALDMAYEEATQRIQGQEAGFKELAWRVISWITCAKRPLLSVELQHALAVEVGDSELGEDNLQDIDEMVSLCAGLVTVDEESTIIRLVHYTTQEFFERTQNRWFPDAETEITAVCITYLSFDTFNSEGCWTAKALKERLRENPLYDYAAKNWGRHARVASEAAKQLILSFLDSGNLLSASTQVTHGLEWLFLSPKFAPRQWHMAGVHVAAYFGLEKEMEALLHSGHDLNARDTMNMTPLLLAAKYGQEAIVKLLLEKGSDIEMEVDNNGFTYTPLMFASKRGHEAVVKLLVQQGAKIDMQDNGGFTPLMEAIAEGHEAVVKLLIQQGAELDVMDYRGYTPLTRAAAMRSQTMVKLLLEQDVDREAKAYSSHTALLVAIMYRDEAIVKLLLKQGAEVEAKTKLGQTALLEAVGYGDEAIVKLLLKQGAEVEAKTSLGQTALLDAVGYGDEAIARLLLENSAVLEARDNLGHTPLLKAARYGKVATVKRCLNMVLSLRLEITKVRQHCG